MKYKVFCIYDVKVGAYMQPFLMQTKGQALRAFTDLANDGQSQISKHPEDFTLFQIAEYDESEGTYTNEMAKISLGTALEFKKENM